MNSCANSVQHWTQCHGWWSFFEQQAIWLIVQRSRPIKNEFVDCGVEVASEGLGEFPVPRHAAPKRMNGNQIAPLIHGERIGEIARSQGTHGKSFDSAAVQRCTGAEYGAVHHTLARPADNDM